MIEYSNHITNFYGFDKNMNYYTDILLILKSLHSY